MPQRYGKKEKKQIEAKIRALAAEGLKDPQIAERLSADGLSTAKGRAWTASAVGGMRFRMGLLFRRKRKSTNSKATADVAKPRSSRDLSDKIALSELVLGSQMAEEQKLKLLRALFV